MNLWTREQVINLNNYQRSGIFHPFTCGEKGCRAELVATVYGWICPFDDYRQDWAHDFMLEFNEKEHIKCIGI